MEDDSSEYFVDDDSGHDKKYIKESRSQKDNNYMGKNIGNLSKSNSYSFDDQTDIIS